MTLITGYNGVLRSRVISRWKELEREKLEPQIPTHAEALRLAAEYLIQGESEALSRKLIELALAGNVACLKTAIERLIPVCKSRPVSLLDMPKVDSVADASDLTVYVIDAIAEGKVSPVEGEIISRVCERHLKALEVRDLESRLSALEGKLMDKQG